MVYDGIKFIDIVFENVDFVRIDGRYIGLIFCDDIRKRISNLGCNAFGELEICHRFYLSINKDGNQPHKAFGCCDSQGTFDRLTEYNDITSIEILTTNDKEYHIMMHWHEDDEYDNRYQSSEISADGNLYIVISENEDVHTVFEEELNEKDGYWGWLRTDWGEKEETENDK